MNVIEKRDYIHSHLHQIDDRIINEVFNKIHSYIDDKSDNLSEELKVALDQGLESLEQGKSSSHEDVMTRMKKKYPSLIK
ncbi:MAG: hypothetical protein PF517_09500 [Salinivirgaceae bacterium]|nr:hypothetical protein [Salinivirgaceae bacterium]